MIVFKIALRLIAFPFIAGIILIAAIRNYLYTCWCWLRYGGELVTHDVFHPNTIREQLKKLGELLEKKSE